MNHSLFTRLIFKDLFLARWFVLGALVLGAATLAMTPFGPISFYVGTVSYLCVLIILNIMVVSTIVAQEKKDKVLLFVLSLPISTGQYMLAKMAASLLAFIVPLALTFVGTLILFDATALPNGFIPFATTVVTYILLYFCVFLAVALVADSGFWNALVIIFGNISINFFIALLFGLPSVIEYGRTETAVWSPDIVFFIAVELALCVLVLATAVYLSLRKKDFI